VHYNNSYWTLCSTMNFLLFFFFFFQAEDGIRDKLVTGVQTCALPISFFDTWTSHKIPNFPAHTAAFRALHYSLEPSILNRSEERRVGKECRSRWSPDH